MRVVVDRDRDRRSGHERREVVVQQRPVERVGMVVVGGRRCSIGLVVTLDVVRVELDQRQVVDPGELDQTLGDRGLAGARSARDTDQERSVVERIHRVQR